MILVDEVSREPFQQDTLSVDRIMLIRTTAAVMPVEIIDMHDPVDLGFPRIGFFRNITMYCR